MNRKLASIIFVAILILSLPITLILVNKSQDNRSSAAAADKLETEEGVLGGNAISKQDSSASNNSYVEFGINSISSFPFGPQPRIDTPLSQGTKFVSPTGTGTSCTQSSPCSLITAANNATAGDVVFMRGGTYTLSDYVYFNKNTSTSQYITFESFPGEWAILDGSTLPLPKDYLRAYGNYYKFRNFEVRNMPAQGIFIQGNYNIVDGVYAHHNKLTGINIYSPSNITDASMGSNNTIQNVKSTDNSDVGLTGGDFNDGGNADGISISGGVNNTIKNVYVANNSDDGFDSWRSNGTKVSYSIATNNGFGTNGNGIGFKLGGIAPSGYTEISYSLAYNNRTGNFDPNGGENVTMLNVTSWSSRDYGIYAYPTTTIKNSISVGSPKGNIVGQNGSTTGTQANNSWQRSGTPAFISTDPASPNFLKPTAGGGFEDIGAWAGTTTQISSGPTSLPTNPPSNISTPTPIQASGSIVAFPGAQGWGAVSKGGRGGSVIEVTNLNDSGAGSFRSAVTASGPRIVVFRTGGTITLESPINVSNPYLTIAGQTAPGGGITIKGGSFIIAANEVIIRGMRFRNGTTSTNSQMWDTLGIYSTDSGTPARSNIIFDHNSISWGIDENLTSYSNVNNITYSWNIVSEALMNAQHDKGPHSMGTLIGGRANNVSFHHNLMAHNNQRNVRVQGNVPLEVVNNIFYNWGEWGMQVDQNPYVTPNEDPHLNIISNYYKSGSNSNTGRTIRLTGPFTGSELVYVSGNITPQRTSNSQSEWLAITDGSTRTQLQKNTPWAMSENPISVTQYPNFTNTIYQCVGAITQRDSVDTRIISDAQNGTGSIIDSPSQVGGWPTLATSTAPNDSDHDGMPDSWETSKGLNSTNANDRNNIAPSGYTWVEEYINSLFPNSCL